MADMEGVQQQQQQQQPNDASAVLRVVSRSASPSKAAETVRLRLKHMVDLGAI